ncbi:MAG: LptF/LptG family permease, partial [Proteobacteria bacterium]|nr:LptF/LptG family permease [Pseudomonadota bacterium]
MSGTDERHGRPSDKVAHYHGRHSRSAFCHPMPRFSILDRYFLREFLHGTFTTSAVLLVILTGSTFANLINDVATGRLPSDVMFTVLGLHMVTMLQTLLPVGMFLGMLLGLGRMYRESEMHVLSASGFGPKGLLKPAAIFGMAIAIMVALVA